jgi:hypothetical protein
MGTVVLNHDAEITLRRVHYDIATASEIGSRDIDRLLAIGLVVRPSDRAGDWIQRP